LGGAGRLSGPPRPPGAWRAAGGGGKGRAGRHSRLRPRLWSRRMITLPTPAGGLAQYRLTGTPLAPRTPRRPLAGTAFAAAHVVTDPLAERDPWEGRPAVDWDTTLKFRHFLWDQGLGLAEAMDTAQRGMGVD